jgi:hypothetical protein
MWWIKFILLISITVSVTWLIVWGALWLEKNKQKYPQLYSQKGVLRFFLWLVLSSGDIR